MLRDHGRWLCGETQTTNGHPPAGHLPEWRAVWPEGTEAEEMTPSLGLGKVLNESGSRAHCIRNKGVASALGGRRDSRGRNPHLPALNHPGGE